MKFQIVVCLLLAANPTWAANVLTQHNNNARTGANLQETLLNTSNVNVAQFGKLFERYVEGHIYAQPLYVENLKMNDGKTHNMVFVTTQHNNVYAYDADGIGEDPLWAVNLGPSIPTTDFGCCYQDIKFEVGIVSTPVIDLATKTIYIVAANRLPDNFNEQHLLFAIDITTGAQKLPPVRISGMITNQTNQHVYFDSNLQMQRPGLLLSKGNLYIAFGSYGDIGQYHGWIFSYNPTTLQQTGISCLTPNSLGAGIWQSGQGLATNDNDSLGRVYFASGNAMELTPQLVPTDHGNTVGYVRLGANGLSIGDWFTPYNWQYLDDNDVDLGSSGVILIPNTNLCIAGSKEGKIYVLNCDKMGNLSNGDQNIVQSFQAVQGNNAPRFGHIHGTPIFWNGPMGGYLYVWGEADYLRAFEFKNGVFNPEAVSQSPMPAPPKSMPGGILSLSANGALSGTGIVWANLAIGDAVQDVRPGILRAFNAENLGQELWNSKQNEGRDGLGDFAKFNPPTIANGKVYMATFNANGIVSKLVVYGLLGK
jgi:hypothetical protein